MAITGGLPIARFWVCCTTLPGLTLLRLAITERLSVVGTLFSNIIASFKIFPNIDTIFEPDYPTWVNTLRFAPTRRFLFANNDSIQGHFIQTNQTWLEFGEALGFVLRMAQDSELGCAYPRCADPQYVGNLLVCGACKDTYHCSAYCQARSVYLSPACILIMED